MNKYEILEGKLTAINAYIDTMCLESNATMEYLKQYKEYVNELIIAIQNRTIRNSNGAVMGLLRGVQIPLHRITDSASNGSVFPVVTEHFSASSDHAFL